LLLRRWAHHVVFSSLGHIPFCLASPLLGGWTNLCRHWPDLCATGQIPLDRPGSGRGGPSLLEGPMLGMATHLVLLRRMPHPLSDVAPGSGVAQMACCLAVLVVSWRKPCSVSDNAATMTFSNVMLLLGGAVERS
jgi:hypothetical protein